MGTAIGDLRAGLRTEADNAQTALQAAAGILTRLSQTAQNLERADLLPTQFTGLVSGYRFGSGEGAPGNKKMPAHTFEVQVPDTGLWLHVCVGSDKFDAFMATADPPIEEMSPDAINGKMVTVQRDPSYGRVVPLCFGIPVDPGTPVLIVDDDGQDCRRGDRIRIRDSRDGKTASATLLRKEGRQLIYQRDDRKSETSFFVGTSNTQRPYRIIRLGGTTVVERESIGVDRNGTPLFAGDRVKDFYDPGATICILLGKNTGGDASFQYASYRENSGTTDGGGANFEGRSAYGLRSDYIERIRPVDELASVA